MSILTTYVTDWLCCETVDGVGGAGASPLLCEAKLSGSVSLRISKRSGLFPILRGQKLRTRFWGSAESENNLIQHLDAPRVGREHVWCDDAGGAGCVEEGISITVIIHDDRLMTVIAFNSERPPTHSHRLKKIRLFLITTFYLHKHFTSHFSLWL